MEWWGNSSLLAVAATGGDLSYTVVVAGVTYRVHEFTTVGSNTLTVLGGGQVEYLLLAGGGGGSGGSSGGGGGAGGILQGSAILTPGAYSIAIGDGGAAG